MMAFYSSQVVTMSDKRRALTLTIDTNSSEDMQMLLKQALYEINQLLPLPKDATSSQIQQANEKVIQVSTSGERITQGHTQGSLGKYNFSFFHSSREFKALEDQLLEQGYKLQKLQYAFSEKEQYVHPSLPTKIITGNPLEIKDSAPPVTEL